MISFVRTTHSEEACLRLSHGDASASCPDRLCRHRRSTRLDACKPACGPPFCTHRLLSQAARPILLPVMVGCDDGSLDLSGQVRASAPFKQNLATERFHEERGVSLIANSCLFLCGTGRAAMLLLDSQPGSCPVLCIPYSHSPDHPFSLRHLSILLSYPEFTTFLQMSAGSALSRPARSLHFTHLTQVLAGVLHCPATVVAHSFIL